MGSFFIDTSSGRVATRPQLVWAGICPPADDPPRPWHPVRGDGDATTLWYSVMRKHTRGIWIGTLAFRHSDHHSWLQEHEWEDVPVEDIVAFGPAGPDVPDRRQPFG